MRNIIKIIIITVVAIVLIMPNILVQSAPAPTNPVRTDATIQISNDTDVSEDNIANRRRTVAGAIGLSLQEISAARTRLVAADINEKSNLWTIRKNILEWLASEESYFQKAESELSADNITLEDIKNIAKNIKTHRDDSYNKNLANALDFILALEVSRFTGIADDRWHRINTDIQRIERAGLIRRNFFAAEMAKARIMIDGAKTLSQRALVLSENIYISQTQEEQNQNIENIKPAEEKATPSEQEIVKEEALNIRELCEAAIVNIRLGYGEFVKISSAVRRIMRVNR